MWVFIWKATSHYNASSEVFMNFSDAWDNFKELTVIKFPDVILEVDKPNTDYFVGNEMTVDEMLRRGFALPEAA